MLYVCEPVLDGNETKYLLDCISDNWISSGGKYNTIFEDKFNRYLGLEYSISCSSCTAGLHMALLALGIGQGDEVIIPDFTLIVSANTVLQTGAIPVFVDVDPLTWCIDPGQIEKRITPRTRAIMAVHMYGHPCNMPAIMEIARKHQLFVIEDCAEAQGAEIDGQKVGTFGDVACFSFYANKIVTTGEGGMVVCKDAAIAERVKLLRNQGFQEPRFVHQVMGFNYRMTNLQAAIGVAQMEKVEEKIDKKRWIAHTYNRFLNGKAEFTLPYEAPEAKNVYWMYGILINHQAGVNKTDLMTRLYKKGIETRSFFCPMHMQPVFEQNKIFFASTPNGSSFPISTDLWERGLYLPSGMGLTRDQIEEVCDILLTCVQNSQSE